MVDFGMPSLDDPPEPPLIEREQLAALVAWANTKSEWLQLDVDQTRSRGLTVYPQHLANIEGYQFMAEAPDESYDGYWD